MAEYWPLIAAVVAVCLLVIAYAVWEWRRDRRTLQGQDDWSWPEEDDRG